MSTLPQPPTDISNHPKTSPNVSVGSTAKEIEGDIGMVTSESPILTEIGKDIELPKEVAAIGVQVNPTVVSIPPKVSQMGVKPAGTNVTVSTGASITLPLSDDQIAAGLHESVTSSWRWMAEWCVRKLKQLHIGLKRIGGKTVEIKEI